MSENKNNGIWELEWSSFRNFRTLGSGLHRQKKESGLQSKNDWAPGSKPEMSALKGTSPPPLWDPALYRRTIFHAECTLGNIKFGDFSANRTVRSLVSSRSLQLLARSKLLQLYDDLICLRVAKVNEGPHKMVQSQHYSICLRGVCNIL